MEKEINIELDTLYGNFFYESFNLTDCEIIEYEDWLRRSLKSVENFLKDKLAISKKITLNINLCSDIEIIDLNTEYRSKSKITDVLSFPLQENIRGEDYDSFLPEVELGDIFICHSVCQKQALEFNISYYEEFVHLLIHGALHLCGYDHEENEVEEKLMESLERYLIENISV